VIDGGGERMLQKYFTPSRLMTFSAQRGEPNDGESVPACAIYVLLQKICKMRAETILSLYVLPKHFAKQICSTPQRESLARRSLLLSYYVAPECRQSACGASHKLFIELAIQIW